MSELCGEEHRRLIGAGRREERLVGHAAQVPSEFIPEPKDAQAKATPAAFRIR